MTQVSNQQRPTPAEDEIDLVDLIRLLWSWRWVILGLTLAGGLAAGTYGAVQPDEYRAEALVSPTQDVGGSNQIGGMARMAGIDLDEGVATTDRALALMRSRTFLAALVEEEELLPRLFPERWDEEEAVWRVAEEEDVPQLNDGASRLRNAINHEETDGGLILITFDWEEPKFAAEMVNHLITRTNAVMREQEIERLERRLAHLQQQVANTSLSGVRQALYSIMEDNHKNKAIAQTEREYIFSVIDPAIKEETEAAGLGAPVFAALGTILGGMFGVFSAFVGSFVRSNFPNTEDEPA